MFLLFFFYVVEVKFTLQRGSPNGFCLAAKSIVAMSVLTATCVRADKTFMWSGNDPRFSGSFSISEADFERRSFDTITQAWFQFLDSQNPSASVILDDPRGFYPNNTSGRLTPDGLTLLH